MWTQRVVLLSSLQSMADRDRELPSAMLMVSQLQSVLKELEKYMLFGVNTHTDQLIKQAEKRPKMNVAAGCIRTGSK